MSWDNSRTRSLLFHWSIAYDSCERIQTDEQTPSTGGGLRDVTSRNNTAVVEARHKTVARHVPRCQWPSRCPLTPQGLWSWTEGKSLSWDNMGSGCLDCRCCYNPWSRSGGKEVLKKMKQWPRGLDIAFELREQDLTFSFYPRETTYTLASQLRPRRSASNGGLTVTSSVTVDPRKNWWIRLFCSLK